MVDIYISVDIEADGPIPSDYSMVELGACVVGDPLSTFRRYLKPISDKSLAKALVASNLDRQWLITNGKDPRTVMAEFRDWILKVSWPKRPVFVGFNATFDWMFTHWYFVHFLGSDPFDISGLDIKAFYMALMGKTKWSETRKDMILPVFKGFNPHPHAALNDALEQAEMFEKLLTFSQSSFLQDARGIILSGRA